MKKETIIWIIIAVVALAMIVGGFFAFRAVLKKDDGNDNGKTVGSGLLGKLKKNDKPKNEGINPKANSGENTKDAEKAYAKARKLQNAIYGAGTDSSTLEFVIGEISTQEEWDEVLAAYLNLTGNSFKDDLKSEWAYLSQNFRKELAKPLTDKGIDSEFI